MKFLQVPILHYLDGHECALAPSLIDFIYVLNGEKAFEP